MSSTHTCFYMALFGKSGNIFSAAYIAVQCVEKYLKEHLSIFVLDNMWGISFINHGVVSTAIPQFPLFRFLQFSI